MNQVKYNGVKDTNQVKGNRENQRKSLNLILLNSILVSFVVYNLREFFKLFNFIFKIVGFVVHRISGDPSLLIGYGELLIA